MLATIARIAAATIFLTFITRSAEAGRMKEIYTVTNESVEFELGLFQDDGFITITGHKFVDPANADGIAVETKVMKGYSSQVLYTCVTEFVKTPTFFKEVGTTCE